MKKVYHTLKLSIDIYSKIEYNYSSFLKKTKNDTEDFSMYCKNCGVEMNDNQAICIKCGVLVGNGNSYCKNCGQAIDANADYCISCGVSLNPNTEKSKKGDNKPKRAFHGFWIASFILAAIITVVLCIPRYFTLYGYYGTWHYSFIEWLEFLSIIPLVLLWANPLISLLCSLKRSNARFWKIIASLALSLCVIIMSVLEIGYLSPGPLFIVAILLINIQFVLSIIETIVCAIANKVNKDK